MQNHSSTIPVCKSIPIRNGIAVLSGYELTVKVEHGRLCLRDGVATERRESHYSKATSGLKRLVILGHTGTITLESLKWLYNIKAAVIQIDADGQVILTGAPLNEGNNALRWAQATAYCTPLGLQITRQLLEQKLRGQADVLRKLAQPEDAEAVTNLTEALPEVDDLNRLRLVESQAAARYWSVWSAIPLDFARRDQKKIPDHWRTFGSRVSPLTGSPRNAANPANALLNYLYAILEAETRIALLTFGLDPGLGLFHTDQPNRDSLACDVMEVVRPRVDAWLLEWIGKNHFAARDFFERPDGSVRVTRGSTLSLAETAPMWARAVAPVSEWVATELHRGSKGHNHKPNATRRRELATPLTQSNRSAGRDAIRQTSKARETRPAMGAPKACPECGAPVTDSKRGFCSERLLESV